MSIISHGMSATIMTGQKKKEVLDNSFTILRKHLDKKEKIIDNCLFIQTFITKLFLGLILLSMMILSSIIISPVVNLTILKRYFTQY